MPKNVFEKIIGYQWVGLLLALALFMVIMAVFWIPKPTSKLDDFAVVQDAIAQVNIIEGTHTSLSGGRNKYYVLQISTQSGLIFSLHHPDTPIQLARYLAVLPIGEQVSIRYYDHFSEHKIFDVRNEKQVFIPLAKIMVGENRTRNFLLAGAGVFALISAASFWWQQRKQKLKFHAK